MIHYGSFSSVIVLIATAFMLFACSAPQKEPPKEERAVPVLKEVSFSELPGWNQDDLETAFQTFLVSCESLLKQPAERPFKPDGYVGDFHEPCRIAEAMKGDDNNDLHAYFESWFTPYEVRNSETEDPSGLFTGYYEASLDGSLTRHGPYQTPLHALPQDLFTADLGQWYEELEGKRITAQITKDGLRRYPDHATINKEEINAEVIAWVDDPIDKFFLQIQGSGVVKLDNGTRMRVGYAGKNGHAYYAVGRALIERGALTKENVSLQTIRAWMQENPEEAQDLKHLNPSYVFFRKLDTYGPIGAQGVVLTPLRSLAVDHHFYSYGAPMWIRVGHPDPEKKDIARLMIAQDTGGAIRGPVRGDFFWGYGEQAEYYAGHMKSEGRYWILLPKKLVSAEKIQ